MEGLGRNLFLEKTKEKEEFNQYWFSQKTIEFIVNEVQTFGTKVCFLSTPSVYYSLTDATIKSQSKVFDV
jgi:hypothetical protein